LTLRDFQRSVFVANGDGSHPLQRFAQADDCE
jgi:hypothetical protein